MLLFQRTNYDFVKGFLNSFGCYKMLILQCPITKLAKNVDWKMINSPISNVEYCGIKNWIFIDFNL